MTLGETLQQPSSFFQVPKVALFPVTHSQVPASSSFSQELSERPGLRAGSKCPNGLVTVSAVQTQTTAYSSVPCRGGTNDARQPCHCRRTSRETCPGTGTQRVRIVLKGALWGQEPSPRLHLMWDGGLQTPEIARLHIGCPQNPLGGRLGMGGTLRHEEAVMAPHRKVVPAEAPCSLEFQPQATVLDHSTTFPLNRASPMQVSTW